MTFRNTLNSIPFGLKFNSMGYERRTVGNVLEKFCYPMVNLIDQKWGMNAHETLRRKLAALETEGQDLDDVINRLAEMPAFDQLKVQRLKKRRLVIDDEIVKLRGKILPDIIA